MTRKIITRFILTILLLGAAGLALSGDADKAGENYLEQSLKRAFVAFAVSRALNGVISVAQETEISVEPAGVGVTLLPGQILDPINDLIERFSWVMLAASTSLGLQQLLATMIGWPVFAWLLTAWIVFVIALIWWPTTPERELKWRKPLLKVTLVMLLVRFLTPMMAWSGEAIYHLFLEPTYQQSVQSLQRVEQEVSQLQNTTTSTPSEKETSSMFEKAQAFFSSASDVLNLREKVERMQEIASRTTENTIALIVVFVFQTILFPLFFLWVVVKAVQRVLKI